MKKKGILFSILSVMCVGLAAGCNDKPKYRIELSVDNEEHGYSTGSGNYEIGSVAKLRLYPNLGCHESVPTVTFKRSADGEESDVSHLFNQGDPFWTDITVTADTIGKYSVMFSCVTNSPQSDEVSELKYRVTYKGLATKNKDTGNYFPVPNFGQGEDGIYFDEDATKDNQEEVVASAKLDRIKYHSSFDTEIKWYTDENYQNEFDFTKALTGNVDLYGVLSETTESQLVAAAIGEFKKTNSFVVEKEGTTTKVMVGEFSNASKLEISVLDNDVLKEVISKGHYYAYNSTTDKAGFKLSDAGVQLEDIKSIYKFISVKDIPIKTKDGEEDITPEIDGYTVTKLEGADATITVTANSKEVTCFGYSLKDSQGKEYMKIYISGKTIYKIITETDSMLYTYDSFAGEEVSNAKDMFVVRLYSDNEDLNAELEDYQTNFEKLLKVVPARNDTLDYVIGQDKDLSELLRLYYYSTLVSAVNDNACESLTNFDGTVKNHVKLCYKVLAEYSDVEEAIERLKDASFSMSTELEVLGTPVNAAFEVTSLIDIESATKPNDMNIVLWDALKTILGLNEDDVITTDVDERFYRFDKIGEYYNFYKTSKDSVPYISVKLVNDRIEQIKYYQTNPTNGAIITYPITLNYSKYDALSKVNEIGNGGYILNNSVTISADGYLEKENNEDNSVNATMWNMIVALKQLNNDIAKYIYNVDTKTFTYTDTVNDIVYEYVFALDSEERLSTLVYKVTEGEDDPVSISYAFNYFNQVIDSLEDGGYVLSDGTAEEVVDGDAFASPEADSVLEAVKEILEALGSSGYTFTSSEDAGVVTNTFTITDDNDTVETTDDVIYTYAFTVSEGKITKLQYNVDKDGDADDSSATYTIEYSE